MSEAEWMRAALELAAQAGQAGEVPVGALVLDADGTVLASAANTRQREHDPAGHAEIVALRQAAAARRDWHLHGCTLVVTLEPCLMCAGAIMGAQLERVIFAAWDDKAGACGSVWDVLRDRQATHRPELRGGVLAAESAELLKGFFVERRTTTR